VVLKARSNGSGVSGYSKSGFVMTEGATELDKEGVVEGCLEAELDVEVDVESEWGAEGSA